MLSDALDLATCSLPQFADAVHAAIRRVGTGPRERFGARKVYISAVWDALADTRGWLTLGAFQSRLADALPMGLVLIDRVDLESLVPADVLADSTFRSRAAKYNVIIDPNAREEWEQPVAVAVAGGVS